jgi:hypothetical protein
MTPKDKALHTLGRTVVNFQRLEHCLKRLSRLGPVEGAIHQIAKQLTARDEKSERLTLGNAINAWLGVLDGKIDKPALTNDLFAVTMRTRISFAIRPEIKEAHAESLKALLEERNFIIHNGLHTFPWESEPDCIDLATYLESLSAAIMEHMQFFEPIAKSLNDRSSASVEITTGDHSSEYIAILTSKGDA